MTAGFRECRVCGKRYEYCKSARPAGLFVWQDVACCPEHGAEYFARVLRARSQAVNEDHSAASYAEDDLPCDGYGEDFDDSEEDIDIEQ